MHYTAPEARHGAKRTITAVIVEYCTAMQDCDTVQSSCDNNLRGTLSSPAFR